MGLVDLRRMLLISSIIRMLLLIYGEWQDAHMEVRYTDVDYIVFSDAAAMVATGRSPFERSTYRYSPLLAYLLVPNCFLHPSWGKIIFSASDLLVGLFVYRILKQRCVPEKVSLWCVAAWLFNPFTFTIGTRGNCEPIVCAVVLWIISCLMNGVRCIRQHSGMVLSSTSGSTQSYIAFLLCWLSAVTRAIVLLENQSLASGFQHTNSYQKALLQRWLLRLLQSGIT